MAVASTAVRREPVGAASTPAFQRRVPLTLSMNRDRLEFSGIGGVLGSLLNSKGAAKTGGTAKAFVNMLHEVVPMDAR